jgi:SpoVK/Ycf46/Vps4 family AAA+-type ATPase
MVAGKDLKELFRAYRERDELTFRRAAQRIIEDEESKHHLALARDLRQLLVGGSTAPVLDTVALPAPPTDREGGWPLADVRHPSRYLPDLVLDDRITKQLSGIAEEFRRWELLDRHGIPRRQRLLFFGPPGCGKSSAAEGLAAELGLPLAVVRLDAVVSSYLGETASNLNRVFEYAQAGSWILLFDEFDALGKARDDPTEHGEIKRVINAFLQMLDRFSGPSLLIAATNHEQLLDQGLWRRFDEVIAFPKPTVHQIRQILRMRFRSAHHRRLDVPDAARRLRGLPHSAAEKVAWDARRNAVLAGRETVTSDDLEQAIAGARARPW